MSKDVYPIPRMNERIDALSEEKILSTLNGNSDYFHTSIDEQDQEKPH